MKGEEVIVEMIKLLGIALSAAFGSGGLIIQYIKKHDRLAEIESKFDRLSEGMELGLENDVVIFNALRHGKINGESEKQEEKMREYFFHKTMKGLYLHREGDDNK